MTNDPRPWCVSENDSRYTDAEILASAKSDNDVLYQLAVWAPRKQEEKDTK